MRNFWGMAVFGLAIASVNHFSRPVFSVLSSPSVTAGVVVDRTLADRQIPEYNGNIQTNLTLIGDKLEPTTSETVPNYQTLFWNFQSLPPISYSQLLDVLAGRSDSNNAAKETAAGSEDIARFERVVQYAKKQNLPDRPMGEILQAIADKFLGKPYAAGLLDKSGDEKLVITLDKFDCVLFVETVLAIARGVAVKDYDYQNFVGRIESQRYLNGKMNGYCSRLHYFSDWINDNHKRQNVDNITAQLGGIPMDKTLNFMSQHRSSYPQMKQDETTYQCIVGVEKELAKSTVNYIPTNRIESVYSQLKPGDIVAVATDVKGLDVTHTGLVYRNADGNIGLIHASPAGKVTVAYDLHRYISRVESAIGIVVARAIDPR